ncbi:equilibrative nucleoside transporter 3 isoform X2 [Callorhinchus milii]|uniref:Solute carrier family 29 member 3 n=2 Tax=Callorhinchus milii TaxID=7868 RepID=A0A4W3GQ17_CALMI|nr:equilibrative nucleoside transporter 3 isoform X2 [Callorhinchus milii]XP_007896001.1 equilibrative nucleoside transporter 3 isoform X2 [Callorhinchus milii]XP_007896009.1 equilibrative nucleoside transporter 3 isoform X2 [Callorhinchus milii]|eukprot:gi/632936757/ref/XP_007895983.1/ PREDICTED: equilibrative nucleoside transporter 3 isoform X2 [Callorhinchus milii]
MMMEAEDCLHTDSHSQMEDEEPLISKPAGISYFHPAPQDKYNLVYIIFFFLGIGSLLPWNFFCTAKHYWLYKLNNGTQQSGHGSDLSINFESYLSIASTAPSVLCLMLNFILVNRISSNVRVLSSLFIMLLIFCVTTVLVKVDTSQWTYQFFGVTMMCVVIISGASNVFLGSAFGVAGRFPMKNAQALISGQAMGGMISALASVIDLAAAENVSDSALAYFLTADFFLVICIIMYLLLSKIPYSRYYLNNLEGRIVSAAGELGGSFNDDTGYSTINGLVVSTSETSSQVPPLKPILKKTAVLGFCVFYTFFISIIVFPSISSNIESVSKNSGSAWTNKYFIPLTSFLLYNFADWSGRQITVWIQIPGPKSKLLPFLVMLRTLFLPLFIFCNYQPRHHIRKVIFDHDFYPAIFVSLLGFSNGYLGTLPMIYGPKVVPKELSEPTAVMMSFFLTLGLAAGSAFSAIIVHLI